MVFNYNISIHVTQLVLCWCLQTRLTSRIWALNDTLRDILQYHCCVLCAIVASIDAFVIAGSPLQHTAVHARFNKRHRRLSSALHVAWRILAIQLNQTTYYRTMYYVASTSVTSHYILTMSHYSRRRTTCRWYRNKWSASKALERSTARREQKPIKILYNPASIDLQVFSHRHNLLDPGPLIASHFKARGRPIPTIAIHSH